MRKHRLYGFCLALATAAGVALQGPVSASAATGTTGLPINHEHHQAARSAAHALESLLASRRDASHDITAHTVADGTRLGNNPLLTARSQNSATGRVSGRFHRLRARTAAANLRRLAAAVQFQKELALSELAQAVSQEQAEQAYQAFQAAEQAEQQAQQAAQAAQAAQQAQASEAASSAPSGGVWAELRQCESGGDYADDTGNGYYGAYQFSLGTWESLGYSGLPSDASPAEQDAAAQQLQARSGWGQWPVCSQELGL